MTYASYLMRKRGECDDQQKGTNSMNSLRVSLTNENPKVFKHTFRNGLTVEGTLDQVQRVAQALGETLGNDGVFYLSSTRGLIRIADMSASHIRNAFMKRQREHNENGRFLVGRRLLQHLQQLDNDVTYRALLVEYGKRVARGEE